MIYQVFRFDSADGWVHSTAYTRLRDALCDAQFSSWSTGTFVGVEGPNRIVTRPHWGFWCGKRVAVADLLPDRRLQPSTAVCY